MKTTRGGISSVLGDMYVLSQVQIKKNLYGWALSKVLPTGEFDDLVKTFPEDYLLPEVVEDILHTPDDKEYGFFIECDLEYPQDLKLTRGILPSLSISS